MATLLSLNSKFESIEGSRVEFVYSWICVGLQQRVRRLWRSSMLRASLFQDAVEQLCFVLFFGVSQVFLSVAVLAVAGVLRRRRVDRNMVGRRVWSRRRSSRRDDFSGGVEPEGTPRVVGHRMAGGRQSCGGGRRDAATSRRDNRHQS